MTAAMDLSALYFDSEYSFTVMNVSEKKGSQDNICAVLMIANKRRLTSYFQRAAVLIMVLFYCLSLPDAVKLKRVSHGYVMPECR